MGNVQTTYYIHSFLEDVDILGLLDDDLSEVLTFSVVLISWLEKLVVSLSHLNFESLRVFDM